ncbi:hypothetical protein ACFOD9_02140 [Novosphingobium bradum]|uniref:Uncharacterized protein n=1 Tax=Novosphingobium bradum TaxID=1737444 RepID=A0ABV7IKD6_9SPHN
MSESSPVRAVRRGEIEAMLARYPHLAPEAIAELTDWFTSEASALDVGLIASNEAIAAPYRAFRAAHVDPLRGRDWLRGLGFAAIIVVIGAALFWRAF